MNPTLRTPLRIALVGAGKMAQNHARSILRLESVAQVTAVVDPSEPATAAMRELVPGIAVHRSLDELFQAGGADVIHVCTPPATHRELTRAALEAGSHVYVEKPFVESLTAATELLRLAELKGLKVCAGHQLLFEPPTRRALELLPALGRLHHVESYFSFRTVRRTPGGRAPLRADLQLLDILPHPVYLLLHFLTAAVPDGTTELAALELGEAGTVHALVRRGHLTGTLVVTLQGRPVESYLRLVGTNGSLHADYVRSTVQRLVGPGTSGIDKLLAPYQTATQLLGGTTTALGRRLLKRQKSYPGLVEIFEAFYAAVRSEGPSPTSSESIAETVRIWEEVARKLEAVPIPATTTVPQDVSGPCVAITGGTGFLGKAVVRELTERGARVRVLARREPPAWERVPGAEYAVADIAVPIDPALLTGMDVVIHAAAETAGGWEEHQRNSLDATQQVVRAAAAAGVPRLIHISSLAVLAAPRGRPVSDDTPLEPDSRGKGPYVWGKLESERMAGQLGKELGVAVKIVRPGAIVDYREFEPPGRLGKRLGNLFVAVGSPRHRLGVVDVGFAARVLAWMVEHFDETPSPLNLLAPELPTKRELLARLRKGNPDLKVIWLPTAVLHPLSWGAIGLQKLLRPGKGAINVARVFAAPAYDPSLMAEVADRMRRSGPSASTA